MLRQMPLYPIYEAHTWILTISKPNHIIDESTSFLFDGSCFDLKWEWIVVHAQWVTDKYLPITDDIWPHLNITPCAPIIWSANFHTNFRSELSLVVPFMKQCLCSTSILNFWKQSYHLFILFNSLWKYFFSLLSKSISTQLGLTTIFFVPKYLFFRKFLSELLVTE